MRKCGGADAQHIPGSTCAPSEFSHWKSLTVTLAAEKGEAVTKSNSCYGEPSGPNLYLNIPWCDPDTVCFGRVNSSESLVFLNRIHISFMRSSKPDVISDVQPRSGRVM